MGSSLNSIKDLREMTSCGVMDCKKALEEANGDFEKAKKLLRKKGLELAAKKGSREAKEGKIASYIHQGSKIGVLVEVNCETDFVANSPDFSDFAKDVAMHIAAMNPQYISKDEIEEDVLKEQKKPEEFVKQSCLLEQSFVKDPKKTIQDYLTELIAKVNENTFISRFVRYKVNEIA